MKKYLLFVLCLLFSAFYTENLYAQETLTLNASMDNTLYESTQGNVSNGQGFHVFAGSTNSGDIRRALLHFDLSEIPQGSEIANAELTLVMNRTITGDVPVSIHEVLTNWGEGESKAGGEEGAGTNAANDDATWLHRFYPDQEWDTEGGDFNNEAVSIIDVGGTGSYKWPSNPDFIALVQHWLDNPEENFGLLIRGDESASGTAKRFGSRHNSTQGNRPALIVEYTEMATSNETDLELPNKVVLNQNYPNPFNPVTTISYQIPAETSVHLAVYDMLGRKVETIVNRRQTAGEYSVMFNASRLSSGMYFYRLQAGDFTDSKTLFLIK